MTLGVTQKLYSVGKKNFKECTMDKLNEIFSSLNGSAVSNSYLQNSHHPQTQMILDVSFYLCVVSVGIFIVLMLLDLKKRTKIVEHSDEIIEEIDNILNQYSLGSNNKKEENLSVK